MHQASPEMLCCRASVSPEGVEKPGGHLTEAHVKGITDFYGIVQTLFYEALSFLVVPQIPQARSTMNA